MPLKNGDEKEVLRKEKSSAIIGFETLSKFIYETLQSCNNGDEVPLMTQLTLKVVQVSTLTRGRDGVSRCKTSAK